MLQVKQLPHPAERPPRGAFYCRACDFADTVQVSLPGETAAIAAGLQ